MRRISPEPHSRNNNDSSSENDADTFLRHANAPPHLRAGASSARGRSVLCMSLSLAAHLGGYELSRAAVTALFTSDGLGFGQGASFSALPAAVGCVSPFSVALLWCYSATLDAGGPAHALRIHALVCAGTQIVAGWVCQALDQSLRMGDAADWLVSDVKAWSQPLLFVLFVFQNSYVQLLYNQHWAFISSVLTPEEGTRMFAPIAGLGSIGCALAASLVSFFVARLGLIGLLHVAGAAYIVSAILADLAFGIAAQGGFEPRGGSHKYAGISTTDQGVVPCCSKRDSVFQRAHALFQRVPVLRVLFFEVLVSQCLSSLVNFIYLYTLKSIITDDALRAGWSGNFYAWINGVSGVLQFFAIPVFLKHCGAHRIWLFMPTLMLCCTLFNLATFRSSGLFGASSSFFALKTMEYSLRGAANEMLYVSLDYESRYLGKKVISLIAGKLGKSAMAVALALVMVYGEKSDIMGYLMATAAGFNLLWLFFSATLHSMIENNKTSM